MNSTMVVVADSTRARIFTTATSRSPLTEIEVLANPEGRLHDRDLTSDLPGKSTGRNGSGGHAYQAETAPKHHKMEEFSKRIADYLDSARSVNHLSKLLLVASPAFLGELRSRLSNETSQKIVFELDKNLTQHTADDIRNHLPKYLTH